MPALVTTEFRIHNAKQFREMFSEAALYGGATASADLSTNLFLFIGPVRPLSSADGIHRL